MPNANKYAAVPICWKADEDGSPIIRRVLISYESIRERGEGERVYEGTRLIAADPYFSKEGATHKYDLADDGYVLLDYPKGLYDGVLDAAALAASRRPYHFQTIGALLYGERFVAAFEAASDEEAKARFEATMGESR